MVIIKMEYMTWVAPIIVALIGGVASYLGVSKTAKAAHDEIMTEHEKQLLIISQQINGVKDDVKRLEAKQDKHNAVIERTFKLEQKVEDIEKRIN